ncbi:hypothetical protein [Pseudomonas izuensis]|uniref:hypothetical protein n=1 Tax=Pseudomonas izuensis TaxID=2684212 RepID=UPI0013579DD1|nr:hypothetical protein [Pseudomonas izuensis]
MSPKLALIARQMERRQSLEQAPAPEGHGLGAAIEKLIADEVERRVGEALEERAKQQRLDRQFNKPPMPTDYKQIPPTPRTPAPKITEATIERDGAGLTRAIVVNGQRFLAQRDGAGLLVRMVSDDLVSEVTYNGQPVPRKLFGNTPE